MYDIWVEKYRPEALNDVVGQHEAVKRLKSYIANKNLPHLLFAGPAGTGKTTCAVALANEMFGPGWKGNFKELNASDERGIGTVRTKIKDFARTAPLGGSGFKIIFLDEADALTSDAQAALRRTMEKYTQACRFVLSCNYSSKIIEPIQSRCAVFRFRPLADEDIIPRLKHIAKEEEIELKESGLKAILYISNGDLRRAINIMQMASSTGETVDENVVYFSTASANPDEIREMIISSVKGEMKNTRELLSKLMVDYGLSGSDVIRQMHREIKKLPISEGDKVLLMDKIGEVDYRLTQGANEHIQLEALLAYISTMQEIP